MYVLLLKVVTLSLFLYSKISFSDERTEVCATLVNVINVNTKAYKNCLMQKSGEKNPGGMLAVLGATKEQIDYLCSSSEMLVPANYNSDQQIVLSGSRISIENAIKECKQIGLRKVIPLKTS